MEDLTKILSSQVNGVNQDDNLYVNNIIVKKNDTTKGIKIFPYIATERWIMQLGERLIA